VNTLRKGDDDDDDDDDRDMATALRICNTFSIIQKGHYFR
jgi:hypothetical protein